MTTSELQLRAIEERDLALFERFATDPAYSEPFEWGGHRAPHAYRRRFEDDGFLDGEQRFLAVARGDGPALGWVAWRDPKPFRQEGTTWEIGILLAPEHRGKGVGSAAQRLLAAYLFAHTRVHRLTANTELENLAEQRALEKSGFRREGVLREAGFREGRHRDVVVYARLRSDPA